MASQGSAMIGSQALYTCKLNLTLNLQFCRLLLSLKCFKKGIHVCNLNVKRIFLSFCITWAPQGIFTNRILTNNEGSEASRENIFQIYCCLKKVFTFQEDKLFACLDKMLMSDVSVVKPGLHQWYIHYFKLHRYHALCTTYYK